MTLLRCPACNCVFDSEKTPSMPFCSIRCQHVDLNRWFSEEIGVPYEPEDAPNDQEQFGNN